MSIEAEKIRILTQYNKARSELDEKIIDMVNKKIKIIQKAEGKIKDLEKNDDYKQLLAEKNVRRAIIAQYVEEIKHLLKQMKNEVGSNENSKHQIEKIEQVKNKESDITSEKKSLDNLELRIKTVIDSIYLDMTSELLLLESEKAEAEGQLNEVVHDLLEKIKSLNSASIKSIGGKSNKRKINRNKSNKSNKNKKKSKKNKSNKK
jgi:hypothetical protein